MDIGSVATPVRPVLPVEAVRAPQPTVAGTAAADLPTTSVVAQTEAGAAPAGERRQTGSADLDRRVVIDPDTQEIVFQSVDDTTQTVVRQYPDQAILRRKAYLEKAEETKADKSLSAQIARVV